MRVQGRVFKDGKFWLAEVPILDAMTQGFTRALSGLSLAEAAERLGAKSRNAYARYERGDSSPTLEKLSELMAAVSPSEDFVLQRIASVGRSATARGRRSSGAGTNR